MSMSLCLGIHLQGLSPVLSQRNMWQALPRMGRGTERITSATRGWYGVAPGGIFDPLLSSKA